MKTKLNFPKLSVISVLVLFTIIIACEKDEKEPDYIGSWLATHTLTEEGVTFEVKDLLTFTGNSLHQLGQIKNPLSNQWVDFIVVKGGLSVNDKVMTLLVKEIGMSLFDENTGFPTGNVVYYKDTSNEFDDMLSVVEIEKNFTAEYSVSGNKMTLKSDDNKDGDFDDEDETIVYTKQ